METQRRFKLFGLKSGGKKKELAVPEGEWVSRVLRKGQAISEEPLGVISSVK